MEDIYSSILKLSVELGIHDSYTNSCSTFLPHNREWARLREGVCRAWNVAAGRIGHDYFGKQNSACVIRRAPEYYS